MRTNLKILRIKNGLTQQDMAAKVCCSRNTYAAIEGGQADGSIGFWQNLQQQFNIPDDEMWALIVNE